MPFIQNNVYDKMVKMSWNTKKLITIYNQTIDIKMKIIITRRRLRIEPIYSLNITWPKWI